MFSAIPFLQLPMCIWMFIEFLNILICCTPNHFELFSFFLNGTWIKTVIYFVSASIVENYLRRGYVILPGLYFQVSINYTALFLMNMGATSAG